MPDIKVLVLIGSLRKASINRQLAELAAETAPDGVRLEVFDRLGELPFYNEDIDNDDVAEPVLALRQAAAEADAALVVTPEYNGSIPGVLKNAIDWLTRPASDIASLFGGKPVAVLGASPGGFGTILAQEAWLPVLRTLGTRPWFEGRLMLSRAQSVFDANGNLTDEATRQRLAQFIAGFAVFAVGR